MSGLSAIDLFCGAGGFSAGFVQEGYEVAMGIDNDEAAAETYAANFGESKARHEDLRTFTAADVRKAVGRDIDVILGGPSCQPFSTHGRKERWVVGDPRSDLWSRMHNYVEELRPKAFVMENVPGMLYYKRGTFVDSLSAAFGELGYTLTHRILLAADYNVPQLRRRLIVVGLRGDKEFVFPEGPRLGGWRRDSLEKWEAERIAANKLPHITLREALASLPPAAESGSKAMYTSKAALNEYDRYMRTPWVEPPARQSRAKFVDDHEEVPIIDEVQRLVKHVPPGGTWRNIPPHLLPDRFRSMRRTDGTNLYGRMMWDRPAYTMTTQFQNITTGCFIHPDEDRPLTVREGARVQSFQDDFEFVGSVGAKVRLVGNAVPPLLARGLARSLEAQLTGQDEPAPLVVGPIAHRGEPVPGGAAAARLMLSSGRHDDAARYQLAAQLTALDKVVETDYEIREADAVADLALPKRKAAIFVQGCFIYGCGQCSRGTKSQEVHWKGDIQRRTSARHGEVDRLVAAGWTVFTVWEHDDPSDAIAEILEDGAAA